MQRFEITSTIEGTPPANVTKGLSFVTLRSTTRRRSRQARRLAYQPRGSRTLPCRARCQHSSAIAQDIDIGKAHMAGHGAHLAAVSVEVKKRRPACDHGGSGTHPAGPRSSRGYADACHAARRAACPRPQAWRRPRQHYSWSITSRQASMEGQPTCPLGRHCAR